ncbi:hypothetical protein Y032_0062g3319 [Ancylostoma ceylanicum]|uniref:Kinase n=1 Tax=Ancylostoma ceylanicum TaxID=53326 RepID=A0A016U274_9BILA|nr:hypothetical protein Y032_0062g3319 [Ancylostoma ceylanicum]
MEVPEQKLPPSYEWFADQIAGHHPSVIKNGKREIGLIKQRGSDKILKPKQEGFRGECEVNVYKLLERALRHSTSGGANHDSGDDIKAIGWTDVKEKDVKGLVELTPIFYGMTPLLIDKEEHEFLILEDVTAGYTRPAILDVKMGRITYDPVASEAKREKETIKYPPQRVLGFRLLGYRVGYTLVLLQPSFESLSWHLLGYVAPGVTSDQVRKRVGKARRSFRNSCARFPLS